MTVVGPVRSLCQHAEVQQSSHGSGEELGGLNRATFVDKRWENAVAYLRANGLATQEAHHQRPGAGRRPGGRGPEVPRHGRREGSERQARRRDGGLGRSGGRDHAEALQVGACPAPGGSLLRLRDLGGLRQVRRDLGPLHLAHHLRAGGGDGHRDHHWSDVLDYGKTLMKQFYRVLDVNSKMLMVLDGHKDVHIFLARCLVVTAAVHVVAHLLSTVPALRYGSAAELNAVIACASRDAKLANMPSFAWLQWPACPLSTGQMGWSVLFQSTPGVSGLVLVALLLLLGWTGRARARHSDFDRFWYAHNAVLLAWPVTMFVHGSNQWIGVGFPLVAFTATLPIGLYLVDRVGRLLRFYVFGGAVGIAHAVIRPGKGGGPSGALTNLAITKPTGLWTFAPGMYAFVNMPDYAPNQWHPFTICSGKYDEHVEFIIAGVGDWTQELASRCLDAQDGSAPLPRVRLDGPYAAPAQSALSRPILVAVGAGVGITPFLSLMSSLISLIEDSSEAEERALPLKEAHFFWMTRSVDEFLFGRKHFTRIAQSDRLRQKVHLHLHTTAREAEGDAAAYLFRQAVKRQSRADRAAFREEFDAQRVLTAPQLPWCWVNRSELDVLWLSDLTTASHDEGEAGAPEPAAEERPPDAMPSARSPGRSAPPPLEASPRADSQQTSLTSAPNGHALAQPPQRSPPLATPSSANSAPAQRMRAAPSQDWAEGLLRSRSRFRADSCASRALRSAASLGRLGGADSAASPGGGAAPAEPLVPVAFGRPDFEAELRAIGRHWGCQEKVHIYVCGNDAIVKGLRGTAEVLNAEARANAKKALPSSQKFVVTYERFG
ncbi:unnamed protein product [Prorocentrum cordatum]|uniref:FAD-binding FR-type domain-containing protein n=1 Tax=Prorocentrum cordatum TaxID=2364126 RepID=A0ABN9WLD7_9DINO|nr:unnamed protein product [Polarella glacialis]